MGATLSVRRFAVSDLRYSLRTTCCKILGEQPPDPLNAAVLCAKEGATVKAGTQERGTERGTEVMRSHTGNYTEMMQKLDTKSRSDDQR